MDLNTLLQLKESEDKVEFKAASKNFKYAGGDNREPKDRRHCVLGYIIAFCNEGGGMLVLGISDSYPHKVVGTNFAEHKEGQLEGQIYSDIGIRITTEVLKDEHTRRILILHIPGRPVGRLMKFEGVALMRTGESLREMSDQEMFKILSEQEPDFSATICEGLLLEELDYNAIDICKKLYAIRQKNPYFADLTDEQALSDLDLTRNGKITYAALILLGSIETIKKYLPQARASIEYRSIQQNIHFDNREFIEEPFFIAINRLWMSINLRNGNFPIQQGPYIFEIPLLNEEVVREAIHNAFVHRDYRRTSEIVVRQSPDQLSIISPGGFPLGVTKENILNVNSTPRNRLLSEILLKTGIVERSGQGVDKLFKNTIIEAKGIPDYSESDNFQVVLKIPTVVKDKAFVLFIGYILREKKTLLSLAEIITLEKIREKTTKEFLDKGIVRILVRKGLIESVGNTNSKTYILSKEYYQFTNRPAAYTIDKGPDPTTVWLQVANHLARFPHARMSDFQELFNSFLSREQIKYYIYNFVSKGMLIQKGVGKGTYYQLSDESKENPEVLGRIMELGIKEMKKRGELPEG